MPSLMQLPRLCAQCGKNPPTVHYTVNQMLSRFRTKLSLFLGLKTRVAMMSYQVPLCTACDREYRLVDAFGKALTVIGGVTIVGAIFLLLSHIATFTNLPLFVNLGARFRIKPQEAAFASLMIIGIVILVARRFVGGLHVASTDGRTFKFYNKEFHEAFAELNPHLVKGPIPMDDGF